MTQQIETVTKKPADKTFDEILASKPEGQYTGSFSVMGIKGDTKHMWDKSKPEEVEAARELFKVLRKKGYLVYRVVGEKGDRGEQMNEFDPSAERLVASPPLQGG